MGYEQYTSGEHFWFIECWTQWSVVTKVFWSVVSQKKRCVVVGIVELRRFEVVRLWSKAQCGVWGCWIWKVVECNTQLCRVALKVVGSVGTRLTPHLCNALPTDRPNLLQNILLIQNITEYNKIFLLCSLTTGVCYRIFCPYKILQNITKYFKIFLLCSPTALVCYRILCPYEVLQNIT